MESKINERPNVKKQMVGKKRFTIVVLALTLALVNCKDKTTNPDPEPAKTLNKILITGKYWETKDGFFGHYFRSDGMYTGPDGDIVIGTWKWLNNSDSLFIDHESQFLLDETWIAEYCTDTELKMRVSGDNVGKVFYKQ